MNLPPQGRAQFSDPHFSKCGSDAMVLRVRTDNEYKGHLAGVGTALQAAQAGWVL
jgi:hypothetical protein